jgi:hypothetical protein
MNEALKAALARTPPQITIVPMGANATVIRHPASSPGGGPLVLKLVTMFRYFGLDSDPTNYQDNQIRKQIDKLYEWVAKEVGDQPGEMSMFLRKIDGMLGLRQTDGRQKLNSFYNYFKLRVQVAAHPEATDIQKEMQSYHINPEEPALSRVTIPETLHPYQATTPPQPDEVSNPPAGAVQGQ